MRSAYRWTRIVVTGQGLSMPSTVAIFLERCQKKIIHTTSTAVSQLTGLSGQHSFCSVPEREVPYSRVLATHVSSWGLLLGQSFPSSASLQFCIAFCPFVAGQQSEKRQDRNIASSWKGTHKLSCLHSHRRILFGSHRLHCHREPL